ncbi:MAG: beta-galactosidase [Candidatus Freyarchaeota archaeon]|nr:beta-galactosidase [Candidatus Jordarchaeia archaeon]
MKTSSLSKIFDVNEGKVLLSGEIHYFRVPKKEWRKRLSKLKKAHLDAVSTYIPWNWHEVSPGVFDFQGETVEERDLETFLEYAREEELGVLAKPGPYICAEWKWGGIPERVIRGYPEILARNSRGKPTFWFSKKAPVITYLHPIYLSQAKEWIENVGSLLARHQYTEGGSVVLVQIDNEASYGFHFQPFDTDYNDIVIGGEKGEGLYQRWLREKYKSIEELNRRYRSGFDSFLVVEPPRKMVKDKHALPWIFDWMEFKEDMVASFLGEIADVLRSKGVNVPLYTNEPYTILPPASISKKSKVVYDTIDLYPQLIPDLESFTEIIKNVERLKAEQINCAPLTLELQAGWFDSSVPDNMVHFLERVAYIHGLKGFNFYMFSGGVNPQNYGTTGRIYYHDAPLDEKGEETSKYPVVKRFADFVDSSKKATSKLAELSLGYYHPYTYARLVNVKSGTFLDYRTLSTLMDKFAGIILEAGFNFELLDLRQLPIQKLVQNRALIAFSFDFMERSIVEKLEGYVRRGGFLVILPCVPELDENFESLELTKNLLRVKKQEIYKQSYVQCGGLKFKSPIIVTFDVENVEPLFLFEGKICGFRIDYGKGSVVQLGFLPDAKSLPSVLEKVGLTARYCFSSDKVLLCERAGSDIGYLLVCNLDWRDKKCDITFSSPHNLNQKISVKDYLVPRRSAIIWTSGLNLGNSKINYLTSEISKFEKNESYIEIECWGYRNSPGLISLTLPKKPKVVSAPSTWDEEHKELLVNYIHGRENEIKINASEKIIIKIEGVELLSEATKFTQLKYLLRRKIVKRFFT